MALVWAKMVLFAGSAAVYALEISASPYTTASAASESTEASSTVAGSGASSIERVWLSGGTSTL